MSSYKLVCHIERSRDLHDTEWFGKMDPFVVVRYSQQVKQTRVIQDGGRNVTWDEDLVFNETPERDIIFDVYDKESFSSPKHVGQAKLSLAHGPYDGEIELFRLGKNKSAGYLRISVQSLSAQPSQPVVQLLGSHQQSGYPNPYPSPIPYQQPY
jgi:hypothetical protein